VPTIREGSPMRSGFWRLLHEDLAALLARRDLSWEVVRVYLALADLTVGYGKDKDFVSITQLEGYTCIDRRHVWRALKRLGELGLYHEEVLGPTKVRRWVTWPPPAIAKEGDIASTGDRAIALGGTKLSPTSAHTKKKKGKKSVKPHSNGVPVPCGESELNAIANGQTCEATEERIAALQKEGVL